jgi:uncharacterized sulfatase
MFRAAVAVLLALSLSPLLRGEDKVQRPNIVLILADDLGYGDLGCYGHPKFKTPHLDRMAAEGVRLTQFNTPMPYCAPTRAALMTGRYPGRCGLTANPTPDGAPAADALGLPLSEVTLAQALKDAGYVTGMLGKWHLGHKKSEYLPTRRGFDEYFGIPYSNDMRPVKLLEGEKAVEYPVVQATLTKRYTERALAFLEKNRERPFFLYFAHAAPHKPLACSEDFYKKSGAGLYGDVVSELDESVGRVLKKLKDLGLDEQTLVVFTSDNGPWFGGSSGGLRGMKGTTWEGGYRVPCIVRWPGNLPAKQTSDGLATMADLFATALAAAGVTPPHGRTLDGRDLLPMLEGKARSPHDVILEYQGDRIAAVRDARWKLHLIPARDNRIVEAGDTWIDPRAPDGVTLLAPFEQFKPTAYPGLREGDETKAGSLFDLEKDPGEQHDVAAKNPTVVARLKAAYEQASKDLSAKADKSAALPEYRPVSGWPKLPDEIKLGSVSAVATDSADRVYVFHRGKHPILVFDRDGKFLRSWGDDLVKTAHGLRIDHENNVWVTDIGNHQVLKFDAEGKLLLTLGKKGDPGDAPDRFNKPTDVAVAPTGEFYVSDGYGNARVLKFSKEGKFLKEWGKKGTGEGEFNLPHAICLDAKGRVYVGDRENNRVQVFDGEGKFLAVFKESGAPYGLFLSEGRLFVADGRAHWVKVLDLEGKVLGRWGEKGSGPSQFNVPHMLAVDSRGAVYVAEVDGRRVQKFAPSRD